MWVIVGVPVMLMVSMLPKPQARRFAIYGTIVFLFLLFLVPLVGASVNGAQRWLGSGVLRLQPSEFLKPFFAVSLAWVLSLRLHGQSLPVVPLAAALTGVIALLLRSEEHTSELQSLMRISYAVFCLKKKKKNHM